MFQMTHLGWLESIELYKIAVNGNWMQEIQRASDIYTGQVKGFKDVPEDEMLRKEMLRGELKMKLFEIVSE